MHSSILVPLDGSVVGNRALPFAIFLAKRSFSDLHIAHVFRRVRQNSGAPAHEVSLDIEIENLTRTVIRTQIEVIPAGDTRSVTTAFLEGDVALALEEYTQANGIDLIVMATRGHGDGHRPVLGSVTNELIKRTATPVLLVPQKSRESTNSHELELGRILIVLDGKHSSEAVIDKAVAFADPERTHLVLLTSAIPILREGFFWSSRRVDRNATQHAALAARKYLDKLAMELRTHGFQADATVRVTDAPDMGILELLETEPFDLVALAVDGAEHALERLLGIGLLERILRGARSNILVCNTNADLAETAARGDVLPYSARRPEAHPTLSVSTQ